MAGLTKLLRLLIRTVLGFLVLGILAVVSVLACLIFYSGDLPSLASIASYSSAERTSIPTNICGETTQIIAIPGATVPKLREALLAAEGELESRSAPRRYYVVLFGSRDRRYGPYSLQLARQLHCGHPSRVLKRELNEFRTAIQLERRFTSQQLLDIYINRAHFGSGLYGIENASLHDFGKHAEELTISEAALLAGVVAAPSRYSVTQHPDRATERRNQVIDEMVQQGSISAQEAQKAKLAPLGIVGD